jgi:EmrB/QacA subfamily drug resistance transporter
VAKPSPILPFVMAGGAFMQRLDSTIIGTSLPQISQSLHVAVPQVSLAITSYLLSSAVFIPISGWIVDRFGVRVVYAAAIITFTVGSALCGIADNLAMMVATRILQGMGGALLVPVCRLVLMRSFPKDQYIQAINYMMVPATIGPMLGPVVGGLITTYASWHWIFFINVPIGIIGLLPLRLIEDVPMPRPPAFDFVGFVIIAFGFGFAQLAVENLGRNVIGIEWQAMLFVVAALALWLYGWYAKRCANPVLDLTLFRVRTFRIAVLAGSISRLGVSAAPFLLPILFQIGFGLDPLHSGLLTFVTTAASFATRIGIPQLLRIIGLRTALMANACLLGVLLAGMSFFDASTPAYIIVVYLFIFGLFRSVHFSALGALVFADLPLERSGGATSISEVAQRLSQSAGIGISATLLAVIGHGHIVAGDFGLIFGAVGLTEVLSAWGFRKLHRDDGHQLTRRRRQDPVIAEASAEAGAE